MYFNFIITTINAVQVVAAQIRAQTFRTTGIGTQDNEIEGLALNHPEHRTRHRPKHEC